MAPRAAEPASGAGTGEAAPGHCARSHTCARPAPASAKKRLQRRQGMRRGRRGDAERRGRGVRRVRACEWLQGMGRERSGAPSYSTVHYSTGSGRGNGREGGGGAPGCRDRRPRGAAGAAPSPARPGRRPWSHSPKERSARPRRVRGGPGRGRGSASRSPRAACGTRTCTRRSRRALRAHPSRLARHCAHYFRARARAWEGVEEREGQRVPDLDGAVRRPGREQRRVRAPVQRRHLPLRRPFCDPCAGCVPPASHNGSNGIRGGGACRPAVADGRAERPRVEEVDVALAREGQDRVRGRPARRQRRGRELLRGARARERPRGGPVQAAGGGGRMGRCPHDQASCHVITITKREHFISRSHGAAGRSSRGGAGRSICSRGRARGPSRRGCPRGGRCCRRRWRGACRRG